MAPRGTVLVFVVVACLAAASVGAGQDAQKPAQKPALESRQLEPVAVYGQRMLSDLHLERLGAVRAILDESLWEEAKPLLLQAMKDNDPVVRMVSAFNLGNIRTDVASARQALAAGLLDEDAHVRRFSALALGSMGRNAAGTEQALKALASDPSPEVQKSAAWAARRVESGAEPMAAPAIVRGRAAGAPGATGPSARTPASPTKAAPAAAPRAGQPSAGTRPPRKAQEKPAEAPPEGRVFFLPGVHEVDERGITETKVSPFDNLYTHVTIFNAVNLQYLDVKEAWLYRQDAAKRGLKADVPLPDLLKADPEAQPAGATARFGEDGLRYDFAKLFVRYGQDYVIAITCNGQTRFQYRRFDAQGKKHEWGGLAHLGMTPGRYGANVSIFTSEGFRLDFKFDINVEVETDLTVSEISALNALTGPQDIEPALRKRIATPNPTRKSDNQLRARDTVELTKALINTAYPLMNHAAWRAENVLPFLQDATALVHRAQRLDPAVDLIVGNPLLEFLGALMSRAWWLNTPESYAVALDVQQLVERRVANVPYNSPDDDDRIGWLLAAGGRKALGEFAIAYRNDIPLFWLHAEERLRHVNSLWRPKGFGGEKMAPVDPAKERDSWPQPGWWLSEWDSILPPELPSEPAAAPAAPAAEDAAEEIGVVEDILARMRESLDEIDDQRAKESRWLHEMYKLLETAERKKADVKSTLRMLAIQAQERREHVERLRQILAKVPDTEGLTYLEDFMKWAIENWPHEEISAAKSNRDVRRALQKRIAALNREHGELLRQQDQLVEDTLDRYARMVGEMERIGEKSEWKEMRQATAQAKRDVADILTLSKAELYLASEQDAKFRVAAREALELGRYEPKVRWMEATYFMSKKDYGHALHLFRELVKLTAPMSGDALAQPPAGPAAGKPAGPATAEDDATDTTENGWMYERSRKMVWSLEHNYLNAIDAKAGAEAENVRVLLDERLKKGGEEGWWEYVKSTVKLGIVSMYSLAEGREKALQDLAMGFQTDAAAQHCGILIIRSLHERGIGLDQIESLTNDKFIALVQEKYNGRALDKDDALRMRVAIKAAFANPDMKRLAYSSSQMLDVDTGTAHIDTDLYQEQWVEWWGDIANVWNILTVLGPNATFSIGGKVQLVKGWGWKLGPKPTGPVVTAKEAFMKATGLQKVGEGIVRALAETSFGKGQMDNLAKFLANASWGEARGLDLALSKWSSWIGEATGGTLGVLMGGDGKAEAEAGKMLAELINAWGVGDVDVMKNIMRNYGIQPEHLRELLEAAEQAAKTSEAAAVRLSAHVKVLQQALPEVSTPQGLSAPGRASVRMSMEQIQRRLGAIAAEFQTGKATPEICRELEGLQAAYEGLAGVESGMVRQAGAWEEAVDSAARRAQAEAAAAAVEAARLRGISQSLPDIDRPGTMKPGMGNTPAGAADPLFGPSRGARFTKDLDKLFDDQQLDAALAGYEQRLALIKQFNPDDLNLAQQLQNRITQVNKAKAAMFRLGTMADQSGDLAGAREVDLDQLESNGSLSFTPVGTGKAATYSRPFWVFEKIDGKEVKVGIFKPSGPHFPDHYDLRGELFYSRVAKSLGIEVPECKIVDLMPDPALGRVRGVFVRMAPGVPLLSQGYGGAFAVKQQLARELALSLVLGDHDRKLDNFLVDYRGRLISIDHGMTDPTGKNGFWGDGGETVSEAYIVQIWKEGIFRIERWGRQNLQPLDELLSAEVMQDTIRKMKPVIADPEKLKALVDSVYSGKEAEAAMRVLPRRLKALEGFVDQNFGRGLSASPSAQRPSARVLPFRAPLWVTPSAPVVREDMAWAA